MAVGRRLGRGVPCCLLWGLLLVALGCRAQEFVTAVLGGELRDARGAPVAGAVVRVRCAPGEAGRVTATDRRGRFGMVGLVPGRCAVAVRLPLGPVWTAAAQVALPGGEDRTVRLRLGAGGRLLQMEEVDDDGLEEVDEQIAGQRGSPVRNGQAPITGDVGTSALLLPVPEGEWEVAAEVSSTVHDATQAASDGEEEDDTAAAREQRETVPAAGGLSADGLPVTGEAPVIDGMVDGQSFRSGARGVSLGGPRTSTNFAQSGVRSLRETGGSFSARSGLSARGSVRVGTAGVEGVQGWHGGLFAQAEDARWAAVNPFSVVTSFVDGAAVTVLARPQDTVTTLGGAVGRSVLVPGLGPRWRLGLYGAAEARLRERVLFSTPETAGFFQLSAVQRALLANRGVQTSQVSGALGYLSGLGGPALLHGSEWLSFLRGDLQPFRGDRVSVAWRGLMSASPVTAGAQVAEGVTSRAAGDVGWSTLGAQTGTVRWVHAPGSHWVNEAAVQLSRDVEAEQPGVGSAAVPAVGPGGLAPEVNLGPEGFSFGTPASLGRIAYPDERRVAVTEALLWRAGRHVVSLGGAWSRVDDRVIGATNQEGTFSYDSGVTGGHAGGLADWITDYTFNVHAYPNGGCPSVTAAVHYGCFRSYSQNFLRSGVEFATHEVAGYAEDAVRLGARLRVTAGVRWEYQLLPYPLLPNTALDAALAGASGLPSWGRTTSLPEDRNNAGPRVSLTWSPGGGRPWLTVQAGYGMYFGRLAGATLRSALTETGEAASTVGIRITPKTEVGCPQVANQGFGYLCSFAYAPVGVAEVQGTASAMVFAARFRLPAVQRAAFGVERAVGGHLQVRLRYATAWATQLPQTTDLNIAPATGTVSYVLQGADGKRGLWTGQNFQVPLYSARRTALYGPVTAIVSNANATYHSGTAEVTLRAWHGWGARAGVTFSRALDYAPLTGPTPRQDGQFDPFADGYDKGISSLDRPWQAAGTLTYRSDGLARGGEWRGRLLGGWSVAMLGRAGSGAPYSYGIFGGTRLAGGYESINGSGGATYLPTVGRNTLRLPRGSKLDVRTAREVGAGRRVKVGVHVDAFNLLNTVSLSRVESRAFLLGDAGSVGGMTPLVFQDAATVAAEGVSVPAFGTPLSSSSGVSRERTMQVGLRVGF